MGLIMMVMAIPTMMIPMKTAKHPVRKLALSRLAGIRSCFAWISCRITQMIVMMALIMIHPVMG